MSSSLSQAAFDASFHQNLSVMKLFPGGHPMSGMNPAGPSGNLLRPSGPHLDPFKHPEFHNRIPLIFQITAPCTPATTPSRHRRWPSVEPTTPVPGPPPTRGTCTAQVLAIKTSKEELLQGLCTHGLITTTLLMLQDKRIPSD